MSKDQPYLPRPGVGELVIVNEMIRDLSHEHWEGCYTFVKKAVYVRTRDILHDFRDDIVQDIMVKIAKYLPYFRFQCALKTWVNQIIEHHIIDELRKRRSDKPHLPIIVDPPDEADGESLKSGTSEVFSAEDTFEIHEHIRVGMAALLEYANTHANPTRTRHIIRMVCFEGKTYEEAALVAGCNPPVVGYIIREAQRFAREKRADCL